MSTTTAPAATPRARDSLKKLAFWNYGGLFFFYFASWQLVFTFLAPWQLGKDDAIVYRNNQIDAAFKASGAKSMRSIKPGQAVTMDYREDRVNVYQDASGNIERISCG